MKPSSYITSEYSPMGPGDSIDPTKFIDRLATKILKPKIRVSKQASIFLHETLQIDLVCVFILVTVIVSI